MKKKTPALVNTAILTVITLTLWIGFSIYRILTQEPPLVVSQEVLEPISPELDKEVLKTLSSRTYYSEGETQETFVYQGPEINQELSSQTSPTLTISPSPTSEATSSGDLTPTP